MKRIVIVGGGAAGLTAAIAAAENGHTVTILERLPRVGKKLLLTGNGRCNLGNTDRDFSHYHGSLSQAETILRDFDLNAFFRALGIVTRTDSEGRMYPASGMAASVLDALRFRADALGVQTECDCMVEGFVWRKGKWLIRHSKGETQADALILAAGGAASPNCGTDGSLYALLERMGMQVVKPRPALCPVPTDTGMVGALKGMRVKAAVTAYAGNRAIKTEMGEVQFTEKAVSGICVFNCARITGLTTLSLNLLYEYSEQAGMDLLRTWGRQRRDLPAGDLLTGLLPKRVSERVMKQTFGSLNQHAGAYLTDEAAYRQLYDTMTDWRFPVKGTAGFANAQVTAGGVHGKCVTEQLAVIGYTGLYLCGELLDIDGDCGGYNLMWAWASGNLVGRAIR